MRRRLTTALAGVALLASAGCSSGPFPTTTASPSSSAAPSATTTSGAPTASASTTVSASDSPMTASPSDPPARADVLAALQRRGGRCVEAPCASSLVVTTDGTWVRTGSGGVGGGSGRLDPDRVDAIRRGVADTTLGDRPRFTGTCPTASDGQETVVSWRVDGVLRTAASCTVDFPASDPLVTALEDTLEALRPGAG